MIYQSFFLAAIGLGFLFVLSLLVFYLVKKTKSRAFHFNGIENLKVGPAFSIFKILNTVLLLFSIYFLFVALARPQIKKLEEKKPEQTIDVLFSLDISASMLIEDMEPHFNRLESAKHHIKEFIKNRPDDRVGLVVFSGEAYTRVPLTKDHSLLINNLENLEVSDHIKKGTAIGVALAAGVNRIRMSKSKTKVVVLLTDGENNTGIIDPYTALDLAVELGAKVYTIAVGVEGQSKLPIFSKDSRGNKIKQYVPYPTKINKKLLGDIAEKTRARFYEASKDSDFSDIFKDIDREERTDINLPSTYKITEKFQNSLLFSIIGFMIFGLIEVLFFWRGF